MIASSALDDDPVERAFQEQRAKIGGNVQEIFQEDFGEDIALMISPRQDSDFGSDDQIECQLPGTTFGLTAADDGPMANPRAD